MSPSEGCLVGLQGPGCQLDERCGHRIGIGIGGGLVVGYLIEIMIFRY